MSVESNLAAVGLELPSVPAPAANYVPAVRVGNLLYLSGQGPTRDGKPVITGRVGQEVDEEKGYEAAQLCALNGLAVLLAEIGDFDRVERVVKLLGFVNCAPDFGRQPFIINGASDLMVTAFGERGKHARSALGTNSLPFNISVEVEFIIQLHE
jgi:enamine deaminase RidA (YjgF/YER057c/UK114 family)